MNHWKELHQRYLERDWVNKPSIFSTQVIEYFSDGARILELGADHGQDGIYFAGHGHNVTSTDLQISSLERKAKSVSGVSLSLCAVDLTEALPFEDASF